MEQKKVFFCRMLSLAAAMLFALTISAQSTIKGHVKDDTGESIIGASIVVKGMQGGTVTDFDGNFSLQCQPGATLVITYIGYVPQEVKAKDGLDITLTEDVAQLNEVVVVGYGSLAKKEISSSVAQINKDQFNQGAASDAMALVTGKVAGLNVNETASADPNTMASIQVRGAASIMASNGPLVVIDGIPGGDLRNLSTQDIESITVLKDAGSAAIYGTRGANGVILVTTKKGSGSEGVTTVTYDSYLALNFAKPHAEILSADEFRRSRRGTDFGYNTDWYSEITRNVSYSTNQYLSLDGTTKNGYYTVSLNYKKGNGLDIASGREEYGGRAVLEQRMLNRRLQINTSISGRKVHEDWGNNGMFDTALTMNPTLPIRNADGTYYQPSSPTGIHNPVQELKEIDNFGDRVYLLGDVTAKLNILTTEQHNLSTSLTYSLQYNDLKSHYYAPNGSGDDYWNGNHGYASISYQKWWTNHAEWLGNYSLTLKDHQIKAVVGYSWERYNHESANENNKNFQYDSTALWDIGSGLGKAEGKAGLGSYKEESTLIGFFGHVNYNFKDMVYVAASLRHEGSSKFGADKKWGTFPSVSVAWEATQAFKQQLSMFQSLKPRVSYGETGRSDFGAYQSLVTYSAHGYAVLNGQLVPGYAPSRNANPDLAWEKATAFNIGLDFVTLNSRLRGSVEYYDRRSKDLLYTYNAPQPPYTYDKILVNVGTIKNTGVEVALDFDAIVKKQFSWTTGINYSYGTSKLTKLSNDVFSESSLPLGSKGDIGSNEYFFKTLEGGKINEFFGYRYAGFEDGVMLVYNKDGEAIPTTQAKEDDKDYIGNATPEHFLAWNNTLRYGQWDLSFMFRGAFGFDIFNKRKYGMGLQGCGTDNVLRTAYTDDKDVRTGGGVISSYFLEKGDYMKLENVTLGYTLPLKSKKLVESLRVYLNAKNLFTITGYSGTDPSIIPVTGIASMDASYLPGVDQTSAYPTATQVSLGVTLKFH